MQIFLAFSKSEWDWVWIEYVSSNRNIADLATRAAPLPPPTNAESTSGNLNVLTEWATKPHTSADFCHFYGSPHPEESEWAFYRMWPLRTPKLLIYLSLDIIDYFSPS